MSKFIKRTYRRDDQDNHAHRLKDGSYTGTPILKPNVDQTYPHTHLYQFNGKTFETGPSPMGPDHTHTTEVGMTSAPVPPRKDMGSPSRKDSIEGLIMFRQGTSWMIQSETGANLGKFKTQAEASQKMKEWS